MKPARPWPCRRYAPSLQFATSEPNCAPCKGKRFLRQKRIRAAKNTACYVLANIRFPHRWGKALSGKADDDLTESLRPRQRIHAAKVGSIAGCRIGTRPATLCHRGATLPAERFRQKSAPPLQCWDSQPDNQTDNQTYRQPGGYRTGQPVKRLMEQTTIQPYKPPKHQPFHPAIIQMSNGLSE